jgi:hypothetical protein
MSHNKWQQIIIKEYGLIMGNCKLRIGNGALSMWWGMMMDDGLMIKNGK